MANTLKAPFFLKGIVTKGDNETEVLFARKGQLNQWIKIPASLIESVRVLKTFWKGDRLCAVVAIHLKMPATADEKALWDLLELFHNEHRHCHKDKFDMEASFKGRCPHCGSGACLCGTRMKQGMNRGCGCRMKQGMNRGCGCRMKQGMNCGCGCGNSESKECSCRNDER